MENGVPQGCPLPALLINLCIEPLLCKIEDTKKSSSQKEKVIAFPDEITLCVIDQSVTKILRAFREFYKLAGLETLQKQMMTKNM